IAFASLVKDLHESLDSDPELAGSLTHCVPRTQFAAHALEAEPPRLEQHEHVVEEVGDLPDHLSVGTACAGQRNLDPFLAEFLGDALDAARKKARRVAAFRSHDHALTDNVLEVGKEHQLLLGAKRTVAEAGRRAEMTGRTLRACVDEESIAVAIRVYRVDLQGVAGDFTFFPEPSLAAAIEHSTAACERGFRRFAIHVAEHQYRTAACMLDDGRQ